MYRGIEGILLSSEDPAKLAEFYREKVGLKQTQEFVMGEGEESNGFMFEMTGAPLIIMGHSEVKGKNPQPARMMINFEVEGKIEDVVKSLDEKGVKKIAEIYHLEGYGKIATFEDIDGNYFQVVQVRAE